MEANLIQSYVDGDHKIGFDRYLILQLKTMVDRIKIWNNCDGTSRIYCRICFGLLCLLNCPLEVFGLVRIKVCR